MVQTTTTLDVADNSGAKKLMCIRVLGGTKRKYASLGDVIVVSIKEAIPNAKVKKGDVMKAVIVRTAKEVGRPIVFAIAIIILVFLPLFTLQGVEGKMFRPMAFAISFAMIGSLIFSLTVIWM